MSKVKCKPGYLLHKSSGQARVRIDGKDHYLGEYGSPESVERYQELVRELLYRDSVEKVTLTIDDLCLMFMPWAEQHYRQPDGTPTSEPGNLKHAIRFLIRLFGQSRVRDFGPLKLNAVREAMIEANLCRPKSIPCQP